MPIFTREIKRTETIDGSVQIIGKLLFTINKEELNIDELYTPNVLLRTDGTNGGISFSINTGTLTQFFNNKKGDGILKNEIKNSFYYSSVLRWKKVDMFGVKRYILTINKDINDNFRIPYQYWDNNKGKLNKIVYLIKLGFKVKIVSDGDQLLVLYERDKNNKPTFKRFKNELFEN